MVMARNDHDKGCAVPVVNLVVVVADLHEYSNYYSEEGNCDKGERSKKND